MKQNLNVILFIILSIIISGCSSHKETVANDQSSNLTTELDTNAKETLKDTDVDKKFLISKEEYLKMDDQSSFTGEYLALYDLPKTPMISSLISNEIYATLPLKLLKRLLTKF